MYCKRGEHHGRKTLEVRGPRMKDTLEFVCDDNCDVALTCEEGEIRISLAGANLQSATVRDLDQALAIADFFRRAAGTLAAGKVKEPR
jgi:hypothetical protein